MARLLVGLSALSSAIEKYESRFDMVELRPIDQSLPKESTLRKWRKAVAPGFVFSIVLPRVVSEITPSKELDQALAQSLAVAAAVEARCIVLTTPASVRPTSANRKRLAAVFDKIPADGVVRCWEPTGIWERDDIVSTAKSLGVLPVFDAAREALTPGPIAYTRLRALGKTAALGAATIERVAERLRKRREAFVVVEGSTGEAARVKQALAGAVAKKRASPSSLVVRSAIPSPLIAEDEEQ